MRKIVIIGAGQVGQTLGRLLHRSGKYKVVGVWDRNATHAWAAVSFIGPGVRIYKDKKEAVQAADIIFITTPDDVIENICREIFSGANSDSNDKIVIHCSGSQSSGILKSAKRHQGVYIASFHPMQTFADKAETAGNFKGTYCVYEGEPRALPAVKGIIRTLGGRPVKIKARDKTLYHIGCVFASNYLVAILKASGEFLKCCGLKNQDMLKSVQPLVNSSLRNIIALGPTAALTGPIARGDVRTIKNHVRSIRKNMPAYLPLYKELARQTVRIARDKKSITKSQGLGLQKELR